MPKIIVMIKRIFPAIAALFLFIAVDAQPLTTPQLSPTQTTKQNFALSSIELAYSRPSVKGRKIFGELVPYDKVWRTGANTATTITFGEEVGIGDKKVPAGKYGLITIPGKDEWTFIISKQTDVTGPEGYKQENDLARVVAKSVKLKDKVETFTLAFANIKSDAADLQLMWDDIMVTLPITAETDKKVMAQIDNLLIKDSRPYFNAAMYYMNNGKDMNTALAWFDKAIQQNPKSVSAYHQKANALVKLGKKADAKIAAGKSLELAKEAKNEFFIEANEKLLVELK